MRRMFIGTSWKSVGCGIFEKMAFPKWYRIGMLLILIVIGEYRGVSAQYQTTTAGSVEGRVICDESALPARLAIVRLFPLNKLLSREGEARLSEPDPAVTDFEGNFVFSRVQPGNYLVKVEKDGYSKALSVVLGNLDRFSVPRRREILSAFPQVIVKSGATSRADVVIHRGGAVSGLVSFDIGGLLSSAGDVTATMVYSDLFPELNSDQAAKKSASLYTQSTVPDDRGIYRFAGLPQGTYRIALRLQEFSPQLVENDNSRTVSADLNIYSPDFLSEAGSKVVNVNDGDELSDIDITIPLGSLRSIGGVVVQHGVPVSNAKVTVHLKEMAWDMRSTHAGVVTSSDGNYRFDLLPPGTYILQVQGVSLRHPVRGESEVVLGDSDVSGIYIRINDAMGPKVDK